MRRPSPKFHDGRDILLIKDASIEACHVWLIREPRGIMAKAATAEGVVVNGARTASAVLGDGDLLQLGQTVLRFGEKAPTTVMPGPPPRLT